jgi:hypothetical protein
MPTCAGVNTRALLYIACAVVAMGLVAGSLATPILTFDASYRADEAHVRMHVTHSAWRICSDSSVDVVRGSTTASTTNAVCTSEYGCAATPIAVVRYSLCAALALCITAVVIACFDIRRAHIERSRGGSQALQPRVPSVKARVACDPTNVEDATADGAVQGSDSSSVDGDDVPPAPDSGRKRARFTAAMVVVSFFVAAASSTAWAAHVMLQQDRCANPQPAALAGVHFGPAMPLAVCASALSVLMAIVALCCGAHRSSLTPADENAKELHSTVNSSPTGTVVVITESPGTASVTTTTRTPSDEATVGNDGQCQPTWFNLGDSSMTISDAASMSQLMTSTEALVAPLSTAVIRARRGPQNYTDSDQHCVGQVAVDNDPYRL